MARTKAMVTEIRTLTAIQPVATAQPCLQNQSSLVGSAKVVQLQNPKPPKFMALTPKSPPVACTLLRVHSPIPQLQGKHYAQPSTYKNRMAMLCTAED